VGDAAGIAALDRAVRGAAEGTLLLLAGAARTAAEAERLTDALGAPQFSVLLAPVEPGSLPPPPPTLFCMERWRVAIERYRRGADMRRGRAWSDPRLEEAAKALRTRAPLARLAAGEADDEVRGPACTCLPCRRLH
jgi:hypothetical protein